MAKQNSGSDAIGFLRRHKLSTELFVRFSGLGQDDGPCWEAFDFIEEAADLTGDNYAEECVVYAPVRIVRLVKSTTVRERPIKPSK